MKRALSALMLCGLLAGCEYSVPLVTTPTKPMDPNLAGAWTPTGPDGKTEKLTVLPISSNEFLVVYPAGGKNAMFARAVVVPQTPMPLIQLDWFGNSEGAVPEGQKDRYQYATYTLEGDTLTVRLLNSDTVPRTVSSADDLLATVLKFNAEPELFRDFGKFQRVKKADEPAQAR